jgi:hypothetical protein
LMSSCSCFPGVSVLDQLRLVVCAEEKEQTQGRELFQAIWDSLRCDRLISLGELLQSHSSSAHLAVLNVLQTWVKLCHDRLFDCAGSSTTASVTYADAITAGSASGAVARLAAAAASTPEKVRLWDIIAAVSAMLCSSSLPKVKLGALELWCYICGKMLQPDFVTPRGMSAVNLALSIPLRCWDLGSEIPISMGTVSIIMRKLCLAFVVHVVSRLAVAKFEGCVELFESTLLKIVQADPVACSGVAPSLMGVEAAWGAARSHFEKLDVITACLGMKDGDSRPGTKRRRERDSAFVYEIDESVSVSVVEQCEPKDSTFAEMNASVAPGRPVMREHTLILVASPPVPIAVPAVPVPG